MAPRAASRLETLGFSRVMEYKAGKSDWLAAGLPAAGRRASDPTIASVLRADVPRFGLDDRAGYILDSLQSRRWEWAAVVDSRGVLLGKVTAERIKNLDARAADIMEEGPSTYRPDVGLEELLGRMHDHRFDKALVTDPDGRLIGLVTKRDIAHAVAAKSKAS